jgi:cell division protein ZapA
MRGDLDQAYIEKLAQYLDAKMRSIAGRTRTVDSLRVAVLAALNIADEYHQMKAKYEDTTKRVGEKVDECSRVIDRFMEKAVETKE